jgi:putative hydrolase of HD superfamily
MSDVNFLHEMGNIRHLQRMWVRFGGTEFANLAEHHFRVFWIAMIIATHEKADSNKVAKMVMVHNIAESRTGDVDHLSRQYANRHEKQAIEDILEDTALANEFRALWDEYKARETLEAKIVKDADNLDVDFELLEQSYRGSKMPALFTHREKIIKSLYTESAKRLAAELKESNPHDWHLESKRFRMASGDWKDL